MTRWEGWGWVVSKDFPKNKCLHFWPASNNNELDMESEINK